MRNVLLGFAIGLIALSGPVAHAAGPNGDDWVARVKRASGAVSQEINGQTTPVAVGDRLLAGAVIVTGPSGTAGITFRDNARAAIGPNARMALTAYAFEPGRDNDDVKLETGLENGAAAFVSGRITKRKPGAMQVRTPAALLGVRGTTFIALTGEALDK